MTQPNDAVSQTPRTDAVFDNLEYGKYYGSDDGVTASEAAHYALMSLCRTLERELTTAQAQLAERGAEIEAETQRRIAVYVIDRNELYDAIKRAERAEAELKLAQDELYKVRKNSVQILKSAQRVLLGWQENYAQWSEKAPAVMSNKLPPAYHVEVLEDISQALANESPAPQPVKAAGPPYVAIVPNDEAAPFTRDDLDSLQHTLKTCCTRMLGVTDGERALEAMERIEQTLLEMWSIGAVTPNAVVGTLPLLETTEKETGIVAGFGVMVTPEKTAMAEIPPEWAQARTREVHPNATVEFTALGVRIWAFNPKHDDPLSRAFVIGFGENENTAWIDAHHRMTLAEGGPR